MKKELLALLLHDTNIRKAIEDSYDHFVKYYPERDKLSIEESYRIAWLQGFLFNEVVFKGRATEVKP